jgi:hypothetical protein
MSSASNKPSLHRRRSSRASVLSNISVENYTGNGLGNLADELGEVWDEQGADNQGNSFLEGLREGGADPQPLSPGAQDVSFGVNDMHDFGFGVSVQSPTGYSHNQTLRPPSVSSQRHKPEKGLRHDDTRRKDDENYHNGRERAESSYDGSDYGPESDPDDGDFPPLLAKRIRDLEKVTRMSSNPSDALSEDGGVILRTSKALKVLGPQSSIENGATRLITAYTSMATHRTFKTRELFTQAHSLLYANILNLPEETIDLLLAEISTLSDATSLKNITPQSPLLSLQILASNTNDLLYTLRSLSDVLQESRLASNQAARKLKAVREMVEEMRLEEELTDMSIMLIQAGDWDRRCRERSAARTCREVVTGFSKKCDLVRERYISELEMELELELGVHAA